MLRCILMLSTGILQQLSPSVKYGEAYPEKIHDVFVETGINDEVELSW